MRDNHTFRRLPNNAVGAIEAIKEEFEKGFTHGMLSGDEIKEPVHAHGKDKLDEFLTDVRKLYAKYSTFKLRS